MLIYGIFLFLKMECFLKHKVFSPIKEIYLDLVSRNKKIIKCIDLTIYNHSMKYSVPHFLEIVNLTII